VTGPADDIESVDALSPDMGGRWLVTTQGSQHVWDIDTMRYARFPGADSISGTFAYDAQTVPLTRVDRWPAVGSTFFIWFDDPLRPDETEHWRQSSAIASIVRLPDQKESETT